MVQSSTEQVSQKTLNHVSGMIYKGQSRAEIVKDLQAKGLPLNDAHTLYERVIHSHQENARNDEREAAFKRMLVGGLIFIVGLVVTIATYSSAAETGGSYTVAYGAILMGGFQLLKGFYDYNS